MSAVGIGFFGSGVVLFLITLMTFGMYGLNAGVIMIGLIATALFVAGIIITFFESSD